MVWNSGHTTNYGVLLSNPQNMSRQHTLYQTDANNQTTIATQAEIFAGEVVESTESNTTTLDQGHSNDSPSNRQMLRELFPEQQHLISPTPEPERIHREADRTSLASHSRQ